MISWDNSLLFRYSERVARGAMGTKSLKRMTPWIIQEGALLPSSKALIISDSISIVRQQYIIIIHSLLRYPWFHRTTASIGSTNFSFL
jgi:hypothetical protein